MTIEPQNPPPDKRGPIHRQPLGSKPEGNGAAPGGIAAAVTTEEVPRTVLGKALYERLSLLSMVIKGAGDDYCAHVLAANAANLATAWDTLGKDNAAVKRYLEALVSGGAWGEAVFATLAVALPMAQHHNIYPRDWPNPFALGMMAPPPSEEVENHGSGDGRPDDDTGS